MTKWAIDLGTTNSTIARWNQQEDIPELLHFTDICRQQVEGQTIEVRYSIPSCVYILPLKGIKHRLGALSLFQKHFFLGIQGLIGRQALERDNHIHAANLVSNFKPFLARDGYRVLTRVKDRPYSARRVVTIFLRELLALAQKKTGERPRHVAFSVPVDSYETYRAQLKFVAGRLGIKHFQVIDEAVAAAIGYGLKVDEPQLVLVIDFGGGTLDIALVKIHGKQTEKGRSTVIAKQGAPLGGNLVDSWLVDEFCRLLYYDLQRYSDDPNVSWWYSIMVEEACRVKESLFFRPNDTFYIAPPQEYQRFEARIFYNKSLQVPLDYSRQQLEKLLEQKGLYSTLERMINSVLEQGLKKGISESYIKEVLMVGGSTLLPGVYPLVEKIFGRPRVRAWQPFEAVALGACAYAADHLTESDFIVHDYAFITYDLETHKPEYNIIVPRGTPFPTSKDFWKRQLVPTCSLGVPERFFKLVICEIGRRHLLEQEFIWDHSGQLHSFKKGDRKDALVIPLNEDNPTLGYLNPLHQPGDKVPRLEVCFMVNAERWLCVTVYDIKTRKHLMQLTPVLRLK